MFSTKLLKLILVVLYALFLVSCQDIRLFSGEWKGNVEQSQLIRRGVDYRTQIILNVEEVNSSTLKANLSLSLDTSLAPYDDCPDPLDTDKCKPIVLTNLPVQNIELKLVKEYLNDAISSNSFEGEPLFTQMAYVDLDQDGNEETSVYLAYFRGKSPKISIRLLSPTIYAVFILRK
jgi:hypothetical protein